MTRFELITVGLTCVEIVVILAGFLLAYQQLKRMRQDSRNEIELTSRQNALNLISRYQSPGNVDRRIALRRTEELQKDIYEVAYLLNFFEELAISIKHETANEPLLEDYFSTILRLWMEEEYVVEAIHQARKEDSDIFKNILDLYRKWQRSRDMRLRIDELPRLN